MIYHLQSDGKFSLICILSIFEKCPLCSKLRCVFPVVIYDHWEEAPFSIREHRYDPYDMDHIIWYKPVDFERVQLPTRDQPASPTRPSSLNIKRCSSFSYNSKLEKIEKFENLNFKWNSLSVIIWMIQVVIHRVFSLILHKLFSLNIF